MERDFLIRRVLSLFVLLSVVFFMRPSFVMAGENQTDQVAPMPSPSLKPPTSHSEKKDGALNGESGEEEEEGSENDAFSDLLGEEGGTLPTIEPEERPYGIFFEGELRSSVWYQTHEPNQWLTANRMDLEAERPFGNLMFAARFRMDYENLENENHVDMDFRELYGEYRFTPGFMDYLDVSAGKRIIYWGKGDEIRPLDRVCPEDLTAFYYYDKNDRKTGIRGLFMDAAFHEKLRLEAFWSPYFRKSRVPGTGSYFEPAAMKLFVDAGGVLGEDRSNQWQSDAALGARLLFSVAKTDVGLYAYRGIDPTPTYGISKMVTGVPIPVPPYYMPISPTPVEITPFHPKVSMLGLDFERVFGPTVLRGEVAYLPQGYYTAVKWQDQPDLLYQYSNGLKETRPFQYLVGIDKNDLFVHNLFLNIQYVGAFISDYENALDADQFTHGMTCTVKYSFMDSRFQTRWRLFANLTDGDYRNLLEFSYKPVNWAMISVGGIWYGGGDKTDSFGQYDNNDFIYTQLKVIF